MSWANKSACILLSLAGKGFEDDVAAAMAAVGDDVDRVETVLSVVAFAEADLPGFPTYLVKQTIDLCNNPCRQHNGLPFFPSLIPPSTPYTHTST
jgi:hypothetical protein